LQRFETRALIVGQVGAGLLELLDGLVEVTSMNARERRGRRRAGEGFQPRPQSGVERNTREKSRHGRQQCVVRIAQRGRIGDGLEMRDLAPRMVEFLGRAFEGEKGVVVSDRGEVGRRDRIDGRLRAREGAFDGRSDQLRRVLRPADFKRRIEKRIGGHACTQRTRCPPASKPAPE